MALKKQKQALSDKEANKSKSWPDLPPQVVSTISRHPTLEKAISFGGVIKSLRVAPKQCRPEHSTLPWLHLFDPDASNSNKYLSYIKRRRSLHTSFSFMVWGCWCRSFLRTLPRYPWKAYVGCSNGILVAEGEPLYIYYLWNPIEREWYHLPFWDAKLPFKLAVLSSSPKENNCTVMVLTGMSHPAFAFYKLKRGSKMGEEPEWIKQDCTLSELNSLGQPGRKEQIMQFTNAIGFRGKFYGLSLQGTLAVIEEIGGSSRFEITALSDTRAGPSISSSHFREYLLESDGEILLVYLVSRKASVNIVDDVEVYKLNMGRLSWVKLNSIGDRTVFVGSNCSMCVSTSEVGCRRNCVYLRHPRADEWWVYDMESGSISPGWSEENSPAKSPSWNDLTDNE